MSDLTGATNGRPRYRTVVIDPPWPYQRASSHGKLHGYTASASEREHHYEPMSLEALAALPIGKAVHGYLFLWTTGPFIPAALDLIKAWGFNYVTALYWVKRTSNGKLAFGPGFWYRGAADPILLARSPGVPAIRTHERNIILGGDENENAFEALRLKHSAKPEKFQEHVESHYPESWLELFARRQRPKWTCLGDECPGDGGDIRESLPRAIAGEIEPAPETLPEPEPESEETTAQRLWS